MTIENRDRLIEQVDQPDIKGVSLTGVVESLHQLAVLNGKHPNEGLTFGEAENVYEHCLDAERRWTELYPGEYALYLREGLGPLVRFQEYWDNTIQPDINSLTKP